MKTLDEVLEVGFFSIDQNFTNKFMKVKPNCHQNKHFGFAFLTIHLFSVRRNEFYPREQA
ncbi:MAG: hypothetical protein A3K03_12245 [Bdellovibrionales bacterium RIFOXYD1_FULL_44_7]|nr:MAG: hypothetical protein A3K03_12245 [Bdellovibrionales bacterium RIFOXYD1_FULL_44_7]